MKNKFISILSVAGIIAAMLPCYASATSSGTCGENLTWTLDNNGTLTISGTGAMDDYTTETYWEDKADSIKSVIIEDGITLISEGAFQSCSNLTSITIPETVTHIGAQAFEGSGLTSVTIPESVKTIEYSAFGYCDYLKEINLPDTVENIDLGAFFGTGYADDKSKSENGLVYLNDILLSVDESLSGECVVKYGTKVIDNKAFNWCKNLTSVVLPDTVTTIGHRAFTQNTSLKSITMSNNTTYIADDAFTGCESLESIQIPASTEYIGKRAFKACDSLKNIYYEGSKEQWYPLIDNNVEFLADVTVHYNSAPITNPVTPEPDIAIEDTIINYGPESIVKPVDNGYILDLNIHKADYCSKVIAAHYKEGKLINVETKAPTSSIVSFNIAADTDEVKVWTFKDKLEYADAVDVKFLTMVLNDTE